MGKTEGKSRPAIAFPCGTGCLFAYLLLTMLTQVSFPSFEEAFSQQVLLTLTFDAGVLMATLLALALLRRWLSQPLASTMLLMGSGAVLAISTLLKGGYFGGGVASLICGDVLSGAAIVPCAAFVWMQAFELAPNDLLRNFLLAGVLAVVAFLVVFALPSRIEQLAMSFILPIGICAGLLPGLNGNAARAATESDETSNPASDAALPAASWRFQHARLPRLIIVVISFSFFACDLLMDLFPISLNNELLTLTFPIPALWTIGMLALFLAVLWLWSRHKPVSLNFFCFPAFFLSALGYLTFSYHLPGGASLAAGETGRILVGVFIGVMLLRYLHRNRKSEPMEIAVKALLQGMAAAFCGALAADAIIAVLYLMPNFDYLDFTVRSLFQSVAVAVLVVLMLGPLPRVNAALVPAPVLDDMGNPIAPPEANQPDAAADALTGTLQTTCKAFAKKHRLTDRESDVLLLLASGRDVPYIEQELVLAKSTVKTHIKHIYGKCGVSSRQDLLDLLHGKLDS